VLRRCGLDVLGEAGGPSARHGLRLACCALPSDGCRRISLSTSVVHACGLDGELGHSQQVVAASIDSQRQGDDDAHPGCEQFCADNLPVLAKLQSVQDQPGGQALLLTPFVGEPLLARMASVPSPLHRPHPPLGIALNTRFVRLAL
jgi:hypothetical protein